MDLEQLKASKTALFILAGIFIVLTYLGVWVFGLAGLVFFVLIDQGYLKFREAGKVG